MKKILTILAMVIITASLLAQAPLQMSYQAVIRDADNNLITNQTIGMQISILHGSETGTVVYSETLTPTTNSNGLVTIEIGGGTGFGDIDWADGPYFIKTETDPGGNTNYSIEGTSQLLTVPYALYAKSASDATETEAGFMSAEDKVKLDGLQNSDGSETIIISGTDIIVTGEGTSENPYVIGTTEGTDLGEMRYWDGDDWVAIPPGDTGMSLTLCGGIPIWGPCPGKATVNITGVSNITQNSATIGADIVFDGGHEVNERGICYSRNPNPTTSDTKISQGSGMGQFTVDMAGLRPQQVYYVRSYAINSEGTAYSDQIVFTTTGVESGSVTDQDNNVYQTVIIGNQEWMAENLRTTKYRDGTDIPYDEAWYSEGTYVFYNNDSDLGNAYGPMYNWYAVETGNLCPTGWRVPTDADWTELRDYIVNNTDFGGLSVGNGLKSCRQINSPLGGTCDTSDHPRWASQPETYGTDNFGFSGLPGGNTEAGQHFSGLGNYGRWWSSTGSGDDATAPTLHGNAGHFPFSEIGKHSGISVRCVRD